MKFQKNDVFDLTEFLAETDEAMTSFVNVYFLPQEKVFGIKKREKFGYSHGLEDKAQGVFPSVEESTYFFVKQWRF